MVFSDSRLRTIRTPKAVAGGRTEGDDDLLLLLVLEVLAWAGLLSHHLSPGKSGARTNDAGIMINPGRDRRRTVS